MERDIPAKRAWESAFRACTSAWHSSGANWKFSPAYPAPPSAQQYCGPHRFFGRPKMTSLRILIADDHAVVRAGLRALLESRAGWEVCAEASDGREAVEKASKLAPDIVILDIG